MKFAQAFEEHAKKVAAEFAQSIRRVAILAGRRATENGRDPIDAADRAKVLLDKLGHVSFIAHVVDEVAGPLNAAAFAKWQKQRAEERALRVKLLLGQTVPS